MMLRSETQQAAYVVCYVQKKSGAQCADNALQSVNAAQIFGPIPREKTMPSIVLHIHTAMSFPCFPTPAQ